MKKNESTIALVI